MRNPQLTFQLSNRLHLRISLTVPILIIKPKKNYRFLNFLILNQFFNFFIPIPCFILNLLILIINLFLKPFNSILFNFQIIRKFIALSFKILMFLLQIFIFNPQSLNLALQSRFFLQPLGLPHVELLEQLLIPPNLKLFPIISSPTHYPSKFTSISPPACSN